MPDNVVSLNDFGSGRRHLPQADRLTMLHDCRDQLIEGVCRILTRQTTAIENALLGMAERSPLLETRNMIYDAQGMLNRRANELIVACKKNYLAACENVVSGVKPVRPQPAANELSLIGEEDFESTLSVNRATSRLRFNSAVELVTLDSRMGVLLDKPNLAEEDNPLGPRLLCESLLHGLEDAGLERKPALILLNQFELALDAELSALYKTINHYLIDKGILPDIKLGQNARTNAPGASSQGKAETEEFNRLFDLMVNTPAAPSGFGTAAGYGAPSGPAGHGMTGGGYHSGGAYPAGSIGQGGAGYAGSAPIGMLEAVSILQGGPLLLPSGAEINFQPASGEISNVLRELQQSPVMSGASRVEALVVDAVAMLFDIVFDEDLIPHSLKNLLAHLQLPVLKAALLDRNFFSNRSHPARKLLDALAELAISLPPTADGALPGQDALEQIIDRVIADFVDDTVVFEIAAEEIGRMDIERQASIESSLSEPIEDLRRAERGETAGVFIRDQISQALQDQPVMPGIRHFLHTHWAEAMGKTYVAHGQSAPQLSSEMETMRELIWSVQPKTDMDTRLMLVRILPGMLKRLREGLANSSIQTDDAERFFAELVVLHANAVRAQPHATEVPLPESEATPLADQMAPDAPAIIQSSSTLVELPSPPPPQIDVEAEIEDVFTERARALRKGEWVEFHYDDDTFRWARLAFSSNRGNYLFTDQDGISTFSISLQRLADKLRTGQAVLVVQHSVTETAFDKLMNFFRTRAEPATA